MPPFGLMDSGDERYPLHGLVSSVGRRDLAPQAKRSSPTMRKVMFLPIVATVLVSVLVASRLSSQESQSQSGHKRSRSIAAMKLWATHDTDTLGGMEQDHTDLASHQFADGDAAEAANHDCHTAETGEHCFNAVHFAMHDGIKYQPTWYPGLTAESSFKDFQQFLHEEGRSSCDVPCDEEGNAVDTEHGTGEGGKHGGGHGGGHEAGHGGEGAGHDTGHVHGYLCLCFLLGGLSIGCILQVVQERFLPAVPYTCLLFVMGLILSGIHELRPEGHWSSWPTWYISVSMWEGVDPHLIFYIFLPTLVFAEAMRLNIKLAMKLFWQVLMLAAPGVCMGTGLTAVFSRYVFPYQWSWATCLVFGSILAATDPVAVVALFNTLGVSPRLTMLISGESLLNDGTAIVLFTLTLQLMLGQTVTVVSFTQFFLQMTVISIILGVALAVVALFLVGKCAETKYHSDSMIQVCVTICLSMLCFFIAESEVHTSGVLTVVTAGCVFSHYAWPRFASRETMHIVWEAIEFVGNTVVFLLAGLLFGHRCITRRGHLNFADFGWLLLLYLAVTVIRGVMVLFLWPVLNLLGEPVSWKEALVMVWSGLRGAVGLVLAIVVDEEPSIAPQIGSHFMFHIGGIAMLTIIVNATLCAPLLRSLGLTSSPKIDEKLVEHFEHAVTEDGRQAFQEIERKGPKVEQRFAGADMVAVKALLPSLQSSHELHKSSTSSASSADEEEEELRMYREVFGRYIQSAYWEDIEEGLVPRTSRVARGLLFSASEILQNPSLKLHDWNDILSLSSEFMLCPCINNCVARMWPLNQMESLQLVFPSEDTVEMWKAYLVLCFIDAHKTARAEVPTYFAEGTVLRKSVQEQVARESQEETEEAAKFLEGLASETVTRCQNRMLAGKILHRQLAKVEHLTKVGVLDGKGASHITHHLQEQARTVAGASTGPATHIARASSKGFF